MHNAEVKCALQNVFFTASLLQMLDKCVGGCGGQGGGGRGGGGGGERTGK